MGSYDGAETCELIGLFLLSQLNKLDIQVGLYRDDGLVVCSKSKRETEKIKKEICEIFNKNNLRITIEANNNITNFLDVTFNFNDGTYKPFMKENNTPLYVHKHSNHPPSILKNIPDAINKRLCSISSDNTLFNEASKQYKQALTKSGYNYDFTYTQIEGNQNPTERKKNRSRKITWFNPPFSANVQTNIGKKFLNLIDFHFPKEHKLHKIINRQTIKVSYCCMPNMQQIISNHNQAIINKGKNNESKNNCNCRNRKECPLNNNCLTKSIVYQATVKQENNQEEQTYVGLTENTFKTRYTEHKASFNHINKRHATTLSEHIWSLKDKNIQYNIKWKILTKAKAYNPNSKKCNLCLTEKYIITTQPSKSTLNKRNELASSCRHRRKYLLQQQK